MGCTNASMDNEIAPHMFVIIDIGNQYTSRQTSYDQDGINNKTNQLIKAFEQAHRTSNDGSVCHFCFFHLDAGVKPSIVG